MSAQPVAIVTGAANGIGRAVAETLGRSGWRLGLVDRDAAIEPVAGDLAAAGVAARPIMCDLADIGSAERIVDEVVRAFGQLDGLVNNAGVTLPASLEQTSAEDWDRVQAVNLRAPFLLIKAAAPHMRRRGRGSIVNIASFHALATIERFAAYAASKTGLLGLTRSAALELAPDGIRVNAVCPGIIETAMWQAWLDTVDSPDQVLADVNARQPMGRIGVPREVASLVRFLLSDEASYTTGATIVADGGVSARLHHA